MARNRKRAKARQARRPTAAPGAEPGLATARVDAPDPIEHASPDVDLAEAQLARGRPELAREADREPDREPEPDDAASDDVEEDEPVDQPQFGQAPNVPGVFPERVGVQADDEELPDEELPDEVLPAARTVAAPARRLRSRNRFINFLQGSWLELQRVQWPDRRQVMQATGVVIGFVIVAGLFLGVADFLAQKLVTYILK